MKRSLPAKIPISVPIGLAIIAVIALAWSLSRGWGRSLSLRIPGTDQAPVTDPGAGTNPVFLGKLTRSDGQAANDPAAWPGFRGLNRDGVCTDTTPLASSWPASGLRELWSVALGEGYAGPVVLKGRVYLLDYDQQKKQDALRCLSLADGKEIWRYSYPVSIKRNHGMSRTVPAVTDDFVVSLGPKCHVACCDAKTGELRWALDLVGDFGATVPQWYAGQCPLIDNGAVILAPGGKDALLVSVDLTTGRTRWQTPNPNDWKMTHSSVMPMEFSGRRMYVYCANAGLVGVSADEGTILWQTAEWKISIATVPTPAICDDGAIFLTGGYDAGSLMLQLEKADSGFWVKSLFRLNARTFGATQHAPVPLGDHLYGTRADGKFACLDFNGRVVWTSGAEPQFGLGSFLLADGKIFALNDSGLLRLIEATPAGYHVLAQAQILKGRESWGPMALAGGRLLARDFTHLVCLDVRRDVLVMQGQ
jgi:outer membrane protein assembly factor BamB